MINIEIDTCVGLSPRFLVIRKAFREMSIPLGLKWGTVLGQPSYTWSRKTKGKGWGQGVKWDWASIFVYSFLRRTKFGANWSDEEFASRDWLVYFITQV